MWSVRGTASSKPQKTLIKSFNLRATTPGKHVAFGTVRIYARELAEDETIDDEFVPVIRDPNYKHPDRLRNMSSRLAAECAVDRAEDLIEQIRDDELEDEEDANAPPYHCQQGNYKEHMLDV